MPPPSDRLKAVFDRAAEIASAGDRAAFLGRECAGEPDLRGQVEALLRAFDQAGSFLEHPLLGPTPVGTALFDSGDTALPAGPGAPPVAAGPVIAGRYKLLEEIGAGGMGSVWMAEQTAPVHRRVAVKLIKPGMDTRAVVARFEAERQALALMDHPNIARVLDGGATADGRPYFVMELVKGTPITQYCDERRLGVRDRLGLFAQVCRAVQHAHQKGVIHRDLKPANVLVAPFDGTPVVKVIDFGVAKATGEPLTERTLFTGLWAVIGTPEYMSPEQAEVNNRDIDTRSDVYSLGVLLYELLTGTTPLTRERVKESSLLEALRAIREEEPPRPSARLGEAGVPPGVAASRGAEAGRLSRVVRGELDWIAMKCLEKDRSRRYETANGLAADVERYLAGEPVQACPPSAGYRVRKFVGRHRGLALATTLVVLALCGGIVGTTWGLLRAVEERNQKDLALRKADQVVDDFFTQFSDRMDDPALEPLRKQLLETALRYYQGFVADRGDDPELRAELAATYVRIAIISYHLGPEHDWVAPFEKGVAILEVLLRERRDLGGFHGPSGGFHWFDSALGANPLRLQQARDVMDRARRVWEQLSHQNPGVPGFQYDLAVILLCLNIFESYDDNVEESARHHRRPIDLFQSLVAAHPQVPRYRVGLAISLATRSMGLASRGRQAEAEDCAKRAVEVSKSLVDRDPHKPLYIETHFGYCVANLASVREHAGRFDEAVEGYREWVRAYETLRHRYPGVPRFGKVLFWSRHWLSELLWVAGRKDEATRVFEQMAVLGNQLAPDDPWGQAAFSWFLARCPVDRLRDPKRAVELASRAVELAPQPGDSWAALGAGHLAAGNDQAAIAALNMAVNRPCQFYGSAARLMLAQAHWRLGERAEARKWYDQALEQLNGTDLQLSDTRRIRADTEALLGISR